MDYSNIPDSKQFCCNYFNEITGGYQINDFSAFSNHIKDFGKLLQSDFFHSLITKSLENSSQNRGIRIDNLNLKTELRKLKSKEKEWQKKADGLRNKLLTTQTALQELHLKNIELSDTVKSFKEKLNNQNNDLSRHPFFEDFHSNSVKRKPVILAPDTCQLDFPKVHENTISLSVVETVQSPIGEEFSEECRAENDHDETIFIKPSTPCTAENRKKNDGKNNKKYEEHNKKQYEFSPVLSNLKTGTRKIVQTDKDKPVIIDLCENEIQNEPNSPKTPNATLSLVLNSSTDSSPSLLPQVILNQDHCRLNKQSEKTKLEDQSVPGFEDEEDLEKNLNEMFDKTDGNLETSTLLNVKSVKSIHNEDNLSDVDLFNDGDDDDDFLPYQKKCRSREPGDSKKKSQTVNSLELNEKENYSTLNELETGHSNKTTDKVNDSFNVLPKKEKEKYKYQNSVRNQEERKKLDGRTCQQCESFYGHLTNDKRKEMLRKVCKHKFVHLPPPTPNHFWDVDMPDSMECRERGYLVDESELPTQARENIAQRKRRRRPLDAKFKI